MKNRVHVHRYFCPFNLMRTYLSHRGGYQDETEQFFIFRGGSPVLPMHVRKLLHLMIQRLNLESNLYRIHSFRIGQTTDLIKYGYTIDEVKMLGRWRSNVIYKYIRYWQDRKPKL